MDPAHSFLPATESELKAKLACPPPPSPTTPPTQHPSVTKCTRSRAAAAAAQFRTRALRLPAQRRGDFGLSRNRWRGSRPRPAPRSLRSDSVSCVSRQLGSVGRGVAGEGKGGPDHDLRCDSAWQPRRPVRTCSTRGLERPPFQTFPPPQTKKSNQVVGILLQGRLNQNLVRATADAL